MDNRYLQDIERLKKLEPIMQELGVKAERMPLGEFFTIGHHQYQLTYLTLDYASLESVLPYFCFYTAEEDILYYIPVVDSVDRIHKMIKFMRRERGQDKLEVMADLIILLHENGIKLEG